MIVSNPKTEANDGPVACKLRCHKIYKEDYGNVLLQFSLFEILGPSLCPASPTQL